jgi:Flp pilus assembly protein TadG
MTAHIDRTNHTRHAMTRGRFDRRRDRGASEALGLVMITPAAIGLMLLVVWLHRGVDHRAEVRTAAEAAAQAAALERTASGADAAARAVAGAMLVDTTTCDERTVAVDTSAFAPGGEVAVTIECGVSNHGVEVIGRLSDQGRRRDAITAHATVDRYRASEGG